MNGIHKAIFLWGVICLLGYGVYHFALMDPNFPKPLPLWSVLTIIGVVAMIKLVPNWKKNNVVWVWATIGVVGMLYHWAFASNILPAIIPSPWAYWALLHAIGFILTGYYWTNKNFWYGVGVVNALAFVAFFAFPTSIGMYSSALLAAVSGLPLMYNGYFSKL